MKLLTSRFGEIECPDGTLINFPGGIIGFPHARRYVILDHTRDVPFKWLQSADDGRLAFVIMDPSQFKADYVVKASALELAEIGAMSMDDVISFVILTVPSADPSTITANLRGPVVVNETTRQAKQLVLDEEWPTRYPIFAPSPVPRRVEAPVSVSCSL
jgi:flagellar assembly factor FliW